MTIAEVVDNGVALLDQEMPGWEKQIDLDTLDIVNNERCVLGQLYGHYVDGARNLDFSPAYGDEAQAHGFSARGCLEADSIAKYSMLTARWKEVIEARLAESA